MTLYGLPPYHSPQTPHPPMPELPIGVVPGTMFLIALLSCQPPAASAPAPPAVAEAPPPPAPVWPEPGAPLTEVDVPVHSLDRPIRVYLDPGHGHGTNSGNNGVRCQDEQDVTLELVEDLKLRLEGFGDFEVRTGRPEGSMPSYTTRVTRANEWPADVLLSLHTDARGLITQWEPVPGWSCNWSDGREGFAILVSEEGDATLKQERADLAYAVSRQMAAAGFAPYDGLDYGELYAFGDEPGSFLDRRGLLMLRRPAMPSVIIEAHHAYDLEEVRRWDEGRTREAFARAVAAALREIHAG